jgi:hypothetical protein
MKKTLFLNFLFIMCAQIDGDQDQIVDCDLYVQGNECVGPTCPSSSPFISNLGNTTLYLDDSAPQIFMRDPDSGAVDFAILVDDSEFGIYDEDASTRILGIDAGAPADSLFIDSTGTVMMGKAEATFTGSNLVGDGLTTLVDMSANNTATGKVSDAGFLLENDKVGFQWAFRTTEFNQGFAATKFGTGGLEFEIRNTTSSFANASLVMGNGASCNSSGQWLDASSRDYKENIQEISSIEALKALKGLQPVKYNFKKDPLKDLTVGFIAEDVPDLVATKDKKSLEPTRNCGGSNQSSSGTAGTRSQTF